MSHDKKMGDSKRMRKLSLSYIRDTLVRKTTRGFGDSSSSSPDPGSLQTAALDLANCPQNQQNGVHRKLAIRARGDDSSDSEAKPEGLLKTLRRRFQLKSSTQPLLKVKHKASKDTPKFSSNSSHEIYSSKEEAGSSSGSSYCRDEPQPPLSQLEEDLYTEAQSVFVGLSRDGVGYEEFGVSSSPKSTSLTCQLLKLSKSGWYWGPISREEAEEKLNEQPDGAFLVRDSSADRYLLSLSFRSNGKTLHTRIEHSFGLFSFYSHPEQEGFGSIVELIDHSMHFSQSGVFCYSRPRSPGYPAFPVRLTKPISRFTQVRSLQYLCRFVIRQNTRVDNIGKLPLPPSLKGYLEEGHY